MDIKPVGKYKSPVYPCLEHVHKNPQLLMKLPERWKGNLYVAAALSSLVLMTLTSCGGPMGDSGITQAAGAQPGQAAPIFVHGDGRGTFGCVSVAPPAFLSEEEAFSVIAEEAKREGIIFTKNGPTLENIMVPKTDTFYNPGENGENPEKVKTQKGNLTLDGIDESKKISFEFVSESDIGAWLDKDTGHASSVEEYRFLDTANTLHGGMKGNTGSMTVATFYDPHYKFGSESIQKLINENTDDYKLMEEKLKEQVKGDLREQVKDFLSWLKGQGII